MGRATLHLTVGLPGTGKTTLARRLESKYGALRLTKDEWVRALFGATVPPGASDVVEGRLIDVALRALALGTDVVLDFGLWSRDERSALRDAGASTGARVVLHHLDLPGPEQRRRLAVRQREAPETTWPMSEEELTRWAASFDVPTPGELDATEPIGEPPGGGSWAEWRDRRWPPSLTLEP